MNVLPSLIPKSACLILPVILSVGAVSAQYGDIEPNDTCAGAQDLGAVAMPLVIDGNLDGDPNVPEIDFYRLVGPPGAAVRIDLLGAASGYGSLGDPFLGVLDGACNPLATNDDNGSSLDSRIRITLPFDGHVVLAASSCCDWSLNGQGGSRGTYRLSMDVAQTVPSITARLIDDRTGEPLPGWWPAQGRADLLACVAGLCEQWLWTAYADGDGVVRFTHDYASNPLEPGDYLVRALAEGYAPATTGPFGAQHGEDVELGEIALVPYATIGSISGRVVDAVDGHPLSSQGAPGAWVNLFRCDDGGCWELRGSGLTDAAGRFSFDRHTTGIPLITGSYRLEIFAEQYRSTGVDVVAVGEDEHRDLGDVRVHPFPIQFLELQPCENIPATGGSCVFGVRVRGGTTSRFDGEAWGIVTVYGTGSFLDRSIFPAGSNPSNNPIPARVRLRPGETQWLQFTFDVPGTAPGGVWICPTIFIGERPDPQFRTVAERQPFCLTKEGGAFSRVPDKEMRQEQRRQDRPAGGRPDRH